MALTLTIGGGGAIANVQNGTIQSGIGSTVTGTLPAASTAGNCLMAIWGSSLGLVSQPPTAPIGWTQLTTASQGNNARIFVYAYLNNPGGISSATFTGVQSTTWRAHMSEWSNVLAASALDTSGTATATSGTTLVPTTAANVSQTGELAISAWIQVMAASTATYTTPAGFTKLKDDGAINQDTHFDAEYKLNPATGAPLGPTLSSSQTTTSAAGAIVCLKTIPPAVDQTAYIYYGSQSFKLNTYDLALIDPVTIPSLGDLVVTTNPAWTGRIVSVTRADIVDIASGHKLISITATNTSAAPGGTAPGNLSDAPSGGYLLQENGSKIALEDGSGFLLLEGTTFGYRSLSVKTTQNMDGTTTIYGSLETYASGFAPGQTFTLTSSNLGYAAQSFTITNVTESFIGLAVPIYLLEFGDAYQTLQLAGGGVLTRQASRAVSTQTGVVMPGGVLGYAEVITDQALSGGTLSDVTGASYTVTVGSGRRIRVESRCIWKSTVADGQLALFILEDGATVAGAEETTNLANAVVGNSVTAIRTPTAGVHAYRIQAQRLNGTGTVTITGTSSPSYILIEDIGT